MQDTDNLKKEIRRFRWLLQVKKNAVALPSRTRRYLNSARDKQILVLKGQGLSYHKICGIASQKQSELELLFD